MIELIRNILAVALAMACNTFIAVAQAQRVDAFDKETLKKGLIKYGFYLIAVACLYGVGLILPTYSIEIDGTMFSIIDGLNVVILGFASLYIVKAFNNLRG